MTKAEGDRICAQVLALVALIANDVRGEGPAEVNVPDYDRVMAAARRLASWREVA